MCGTVFDRIYRFPVIPTRLHPGQGSNLGLSPGTLNYHQPGAGTTIVVFTGYEIKLVRFALCDLASWNLQINIDLLLVVRFGYLRR